MPAIALTGFGSALDHQKTLAAGFALRLTKPVDLDLLTASMRALVRASEGAADGTADDTAESTANSTTDSAAEASTQAA